MWNLFIFLQFNIFSVVKIIFGIQLVYDANAKACLL